MAKQRVIQVIARRDQGRLRKRQEDHYLARAWPDRHLALLVVADGMGGHAGGALASATAVETTQEELASYLASLQPTVTIQLPNEEVENAGASPAATRPLDASTRKLPETYNREQEDQIGALLQGAIHRAQAAILQRKSAAEPGAIDEAGSTLTVGLVIGRQLHLAWLGDSRAYLWRQSALRQLTRDHSGAALLVAAGMATSAEAGRHPASNLLYRFLGGTAPEATPEFVHLSLEADDLLLLCSDGLWGMLPDREIAALLTAESNLELLAQALIDAANANGGEDNIAIVLATVV